MALEASIFSSFGFSCDGSRRGSDAAFPSSMRYRRSFSCEKSIFLRLFLDLAQRVSGSDVCLCRFLSFGTLFFMRLLATALFLSCPRRF